MVMRAELVKLRRVVTSYVGKPIDYDIACEIVNKLLDDKKHLKKELDELKEKVADQRIDLESSCWYQTVQSDSIIKLRTEVEEREKLNYEAKGIITNQRSEIEKLRGLLKECLRYIDIWGYTDSHENLLYPQIKVALGESEEK
jgi:cell division septum initiation protein DivIVA